MSASATSLRHPLLALLLVLLHAHLGHSQAQMTLAMTIQNTVADRNSGYPYQAVWNLQLTGTETSPGSGQYLVTSVTGSRSYSSAYGTGSGTNDPINGTNVDVYYGAAADNFFYYPPVGGGYLDGTNGLGLTLATPQTAWPKSHLKQQTEFDIYYESGTAQYCELLDDTNGNGEYNDQYTALVTVIGPSVIGDPQFMGLLGQSFQVHGIDGAVYNLISDAQVQLNSRFVYLSDGACLHDPSTNTPLYTCWSHPGSYLASVALQTALGDRLLVESGGAASGFASVLFNGGQLPVGTTVSGRGGLTVRRATVRSLVVERAGLWSITLENSDMFVNIVNLAASSWSRLVNDVRSHGLIGQTWRRDQRGEDVKAVEGMIEDYVEANNDLFGCSVMYNQFQHCQ